MRANMRLQAGLKRTSEIGMKLCEDYLFHSFLIKPFHTVVLTDYGQHV